MTLKEFIIDTLIEQGKEYTDALISKIEEEITDYAKEKAKDEDCIAISDSEVKQFIIDKTPLIEKLEAEKKEQELQKQKEKEEAERVKQQKEEEKKLKEAAEKEMPIQLGLF